MARYRSTVAFVLLLTAVASCATPTPPNQKLEVAEAPPSSAVRWRAEPDCLERAPWQPTRAALANSCARAGRARDRNFVALGLSGGGTKAAVFAGEAMFYLQALGLLRDVDLISSVSGGSFTAALYAVSCDPSNPAECQTPSGASRPVWQYEPVMNTLSQGYEPLVKEALLRIVVPGMRPTVSGDAFADFIDQQYLSPGQAVSRFRFADLNPRRPHLVLNSTLVSDFRSFLESRNEAGIETGADAGLKQRRRQIGYLRRRTSDELFHFAFTDFYFNLIGSKLSSLPLSYGVAASAAFPILIDYVRLQDFADCPDKQCKQLLLLDGGANDNQGLIELYMVISELSGRQSRSDLSKAGQPPAADLEPLAPQDKMLVFVINSSLTEATGISSDPQRDPSSGFWLFRTLERASAAIDTYSAVGYNLRKRLYIREGERLREFGRNLRPAEIGLTQLDHYAHGGLEASRRSEAGIDNENALYDPDKDLMAWRRRIQRAAFEPFKHRRTRERLGLTHWHPQCLFERAKAADSLGALAGLPKDALACLRHAARWSAALRAQELCNEMISGSPETKPLAPGSGFQCRLTAEGATLVPDPRFAEIIGGAKSAGLEDCHPELDPDTAKEIEHNAPYFKQPGAMSNRNLDSLCGDMNLLEAEH